MKVMRIVLIVLLLGAMGSLAVSTASSAPNGPRALEHVPGLGISPDASLRDDTIALYEAWQRENTIAHCMKRQGFEYAAEVLYPTTTIVEVAQALDVRPVASAFEDGGQINAAYRERLSPDDLNSFWVALTGATADEVAAVDQDGRVPPGRDPDRFLREGCVGHAEKTTPGVWQLKRELGEKLVEARASVIDSERFKSRRGPFDSCVSGHLGVAVQHVGELEERAVAGESAAAAAAEDCMEHWNAARLAAEPEALRSFERANQQALDAQLNRYTGFVQRVAADKSFHAWLEGAAGAALEDLEADEQHTD